LTPVSVRWRKVKTSVPKEENCCVTLASNEDVAVVMLINAMMPRPMIAMVSEVRSKLLRIDRTAIRIISMSSSLFMLCECTAYICSLKKREDDF
jgi:hypothetical protein